MFEQTRKFLPLVGLFLFFLTVLTSHAAVVSAELLSTLQFLTDQDEISVIVTLSDRPKVRTIEDQDLRLRRSKIIRHLKEKADRTQRPVKAFLEGRGAKGINSLWLINGLAVSATAKVIQELAGLPDVEEIRLDRTLQAPKVTRAPSTVTAEWNIHVIEAPELWSLGFTGQGVVVASMDTGVDYLHPDLTSKWRGGTNSWYDPNGEHTTTPYDADGHGTQTMGIMVGGDAGGTGIGVAPDARWVAVKIFNDAGETHLSIIHQGFQWLLDPDGNPDTDDAPNVINNSWGSTDHVNQCFLEFESDVETLKTAGIAVVFAAGNSGPYPSTSISPANYPKSLAVGSVDQSFQIDPQSSRGPSACGGDIFPTVVAPGVSVRTSDLTFGGVFPNSYATVSGTSFSAPHVSGAMGLLLSAFPHIRLSKLEWAFKYSALDLGNIGADNTYGYGLIDVVKAYYLSKSPLIDFDADGKTDLAVYRRRWGAWLILPSSTGVPYGVGWGGDLTDEPAAGDYDGDGKTDLAVYRRSWGAWLILPSSTGVPYGVAWSGDLTDIPVPGDYDGDGKTDIAVYRVSNGAWWITPTSTGMAYGVGWGGDSNDRPVPGDYDRDGKTDIAIYRSHWGAWYIIPSSTGVVYGVGHGGDVTNDKPVPGDYDGDGKTDIAIYRSHWGAWYIIPSSTGVLYGVGWGGDPTDVPVPGDYDGDGKADIAIYRSMDGAWWIIPSSASVAYGVGWGGDPTDLPVTADPSTID